MQPGMVDDCHLTSVHVTFARDSPLACNQCVGVEQQFNQAEAEKARRRFRRKGPDRTTRLLIEALYAALSTRESADTVLLDIGGGVGAIHHELLDGPVRRAIHVDASPAYIAVASEESERRGHHGRVEFVRGDFVSAADVVPAADVVTLDRVICCYDDMRGLVSRAGHKAERLLGAVYPRQTAWMRLGVASINLFQRIRRSVFRVFLHDPRSIDHALRATGLERLSMQKTLGWEVVVYVRR
jgi:hypothetical protein